MKTIADLIDEVRNRRDVHNISDLEILEYFNDIEAQLMRSIFPRFSFYSFDLDGESVDYDITDTINDYDGIISIYIDNKRILKRRDNYDIIDGWYENNGIIHLSPSLAEGDKMVIMCRSKLNPHQYGNAAGDSDLIIPLAYHELYVLYALSQIAAKEADEVSYRNYKEDYNSLLSEAISVTTKRQLYPNYTL